MSDERIAVEGRSGIWRRKTSGGRVRFKIAIDDGTETQRWLTVAGGLARAEAALAALERRRQQVSTDHAQLTIAEVARRLLENTELCPKTHEAYEWALYVHLLPRLGDLPIGDLGEWHTIALLDELKEAGYAHWTLQAVVEPLAALADHAVELGFLSVNRLAVAIADPADPPRSARIDVDGGDVVSLRQYRAGSSSP